VNKEILVPIFFSFKLDDFVKSQKLQDSPIQYCKFSKSPGIPPASPFRKGGLRGIFLIHPGLIEMLLNILATCLNNM